MNLLAYLSSSGLLRTQAVIEISLRIAPPDRAVILKESLVHADSGLMARGVP